MRHDPDGVMHTTVDELSRDTNAQLWSTQIAAVAHAGYADLLRKRTGQARRELAFLTNGDLVAIFWYKAEAADSEIDPNDSSRKWRCRACRGGVPGDIIPTTPERRVIVNSTR